MEIRNKKTLLELLSQDEFYLIDLFKIIKQVFLDNIKGVIIIGFAVFVTSSIIYFATPKEYESETLVYIESKSNNSSANLMKDILLGNNSESKESVLSTNNYNSIVTSKVFLNELIDIYFPGEYNSSDSLTLAMYFNSHQKKSIIDISKILDIFKKSNSKSVIDTLKLSPTILKSLDREMVFSNQIPPIVKFPDNRLQLFSLIAQRIKVESNDKTLSLSVKMPTPYLSAIVGKLVIQQLLEYVSSLKSHKIRANILYLESRLVEAEKKYLNAQQKFASNKDKSLGLIFEVSQANSQILNNEMTVAFNSYNQYLLQLENEKIEEKKQSASFSILEPISIPTTPKEPNFISFLTKSILVYFTLIILFLFYKLY
ncbi:MAG: hypothetical protein RLZZ499_3360 [Cyanobacteriota bacterium]|jgi:hypothetical protein